MPTTVWSLPLTLQDATIHCVAKKQDQAKHMESQHLKSNRPRRWTTLRLNSAFDMGLSEGVLACSASVGVWAFGTAAPLGFGFGATGAGGFGATGAGDRAFADEFLVALNARTFVD